MGNQCETCKTVDNQDEKIGPVNLISHQKILLKTKNFNMKKSIMKVKFYLFLNIV